MFRFSIRDLLWLTLVIAVFAKGWSDHQLLEGQHEYQLRVQDERYELQAEVNRSMLERQVKQVKELQANRTVRAVLRDSRALGPRAARPERREHHRSISG